MDTRGLYPVPAMAPLSWEARLRAVGRQLDRHHQHQAVRGLCVVETGRGFVVQRLVADRASGQWTMATDELDDAATPRYAPPARPRRCWWR